MLKLEVFNRTKSAIYTKNLFKLLRVAESVLVGRGVLKPGKVNLRVELTFVGEAVIKRLNKIHRRKNCATDVISLGYFEKKMDDPFAGEIFICVPFARKQAKKLGHGFREELIFLFVHGLLHVFGYDHVNKAETKLMNKIEKEIMV